MKVLICIPTLSLRALYLNNCVKGYVEHTPSADIAFSIIYDAPSCGVGWQEAVEQGLKDYPDCEFIHFSNDDICVGENWLPPMVEACDHGCVPAPRIEPAGVHIDPKAISDSVLVGPIPYPPPGDPTSPNRYFYADLQENQPTEDWESVDHGNLPFCSVEQWKKIGPFIPIHFGTDVWFYHRAREAGYPVVARQKSVIYNYAAGGGRSKGEGVDDWQEVDFLDFDLTVAYPMYERGELEPDQEHPLRLTREGLHQVRRWRMTHDTVGPWHFDPITLETL